MKKINIFGIIGVGYFLCLNPAHALGTAAGTSISNTATIGYTVNGDVQPDEDSNTVTYVVDRLINFTLTRVNTDHVSVSPNTNDRVLRYTIENLGNATQDFALAAINGAKPAASGGDFNGTENSDVTNIRVFSDENSNGTYEPLVDIKTYVDQLPASGATTRTVFVVSDVGAEADGDIMGIRLTGTAALGTVLNTQGANESATAVGSETEGTVDVLFGDAAGDGADSNEDGTYAILNSYEVASATLVITKSVTVLEDPYTGTAGPGVFPKRVPGSILQYVVSIQNTGSTAATSVTVSDPLDSNTTFRTGTIELGPTGSLVAEDDDNSGVDESPDGANITGSTVNASIASIAAGATYELVFEVDVD